MYHIKFAVIPDNPKYFYAKYFFFLNDGIRLGDDVMMMMLKIQISFVLIRRAFFTAEKLNRVNIAFKTNIWAEETH